MKHWLVTYWGGNMSKTTVPVYLLLDEVSRNMLVSSVAELVTNGVEVIRELSEVSKNRDIKKVVVLEPYLSKRTSYSELILFKRVLGLEFIYLGRDQDLLRSMANIAECHKMDFSNVNYEMLYGIYYKDPAVIKKFDTKVITMSAVREAQELLKGSLDSSVRSVCETVLSFSSISEHNSSVIESQNKTIEFLQAQISQLSETNRQLEKSYHNVISNAVALNESLRQYEVILSRDIYDKIDINKYNSRPSILYLKEYQELMGLNSFLITLSDMFRLQKRMSTKVLMLFDSHDSNRLTRLDSLYTIVKTKYQKRTLIEKDYLVKVGPYRDILDILLNNETNLDVLIIVDCKSHRDFVLSGNFLMLGMCREEANLGKFSLNPKASIVNDSITSRLSWESKPDLSEFKTAEEKFVYLSSRSVISDIYKAFSVT